MKFNSDTVFTISVDAAKIDENLSISSEGEVSGLIEHYELTRQPEDYRNSPELYRQLWNELLNKKIIATHVFIFLLCP